MAKSFDEIGGLIFNLQSENKELKESIERAEYIIAFVKTYEPEIIEDAEKCYLRDKLNSITRVKNQFFED